MPYPFHSGFIGNFKIGYLQKEVCLPLCTVSGGTDTGLYLATGAAAGGATATGFAVGRFVVVAPGTNDGEYTITAATGVTATSYGDATHIIAQSDNTMRERLIPVELGMTRYEGIVENSSAATGRKAVAVFKIVDADDVRIIELH